MLFVYLSYPPFLPIVNRLFRHTLGEHWSGGAKSCCCFNGFNVSPLSLYFGLGELKVFVCFVYLFCCFTNM